MKQSFLFLFSVLTFAAKSQDTIKIPIPTARQIAKDLTVCDSLKAIHELTTQRLSLVESKITFKDSVIKSYVVKCNMYDTIITNEQKKFEVQKAWSESLRKENKGLKSRLLYTKITMGAIITFLGYLLVKTI